MKHPKKGVRTPARLAHEWLYCDVCSKVLLHPMGSGRRRRTCSDRCRKRLQRQKESVQVVTKRICPDSVLRNLVNLSESLDFFR